MSTGLKGLPFGITPNKWTFAVAAACCALLMTFMPEAMTALRYERTALAAGQLWRVVTAHFVHINTAHLLYNLLGLVLICELLWGRLPIRHGLGIIGSSALFISAALWCLHPGIHWYAGLSGVLHGLWSGCALAGCLTTMRGRVAFASRWRDPELVDDGPLSHRRLCMAALVGLFIKLGSDIVPGVAVTMGASGVPVVPVAHGYGALAGIGYILLWRVKTFCLAR